MPNVNEQWDQSPPEAVFGIHDWQAGMHHTTPREHVKRMCEHVRDEKHNECGHCLDGSLLMDAHFVWSQSIHAIPVYPDWQGLKLFSGIQLEALGL